MTYGPLGNPIAGTPANGLNIRQARAIGEHPLIANHNWKVAHGIAAPGTFIRQWAGVSPAVSNVVNYAGGFGCNYQAGGLAGAFGGNFANLFSGNNVSGSGCSGGHGWNRQEAYILGAKVGSIVGYDAAQQIAQAMPNAHYFDAGLAAGANQQSQQQQQDPTQNF